MREQITLRQVDRTAVLETTWGRNWYASSEVQRHAEHKFGVPAGLRPVEIHKRAGDPHDGVYVWRWKWVGVEQVTDAPNDAT